MDQHGEEHPRDWRQDAGVEQARNCLVEVLNAGAPEADATTPQRSVVSLDAESWVRLRECVRDFTLASRATGEQVQPILKSLMDLVRDSALGRAGLARLSSEVAQWCIDAYYETPGSPPVPPALPPRPQFVAGVRRHR